MSVANPQFRVAVIGAGIAGATCAQALTRAGCAVHVFDKSRGPGGRLATRRLEWTGPQGQRRMARFDHGAPGFAAQERGFRQWLAGATEAGTLAPWTPRLAAGGRPNDDTGPLHLPVPDMPALCRWLLEDVAASWSCTVERLHHDAQGWRVEAAGPSPVAHFDAVVLALPPAQAAALLAEHRRDWAQRASLALMQPCWTLMGVTDRSSGDLDWDIGRPQQGPLSWVLRQDSRPGREAVPDEAHWVVHARAGWSRQHLEHPPAWVQARMQDALQDWLGRPLVWQHAVVHRWRYAKPMSSGAAATRQCWWDAARGLGVCGDFLGGTGVEGAWLSAQALIDGLLSDAAARTAPSLPALFQRRGREAVTQRAKTRVTP
jgi:predicted NAD/FAD-dependent oxidoreductase